MRGPAGCLGGCLTKLLVWAVVATALVWAFTVALNPWALHIGDRPTPLLYWHGLATVTAEDGRSYPLYLFFGPGRPGGFHGAGRRQGKAVSANLTGTAWLCLAPGIIQRMKLSGTMYGGYASMRESLIDFRLLEWGKSFSIDYQSRGFFDLAGTWHGQELVMDIPGEQGIRLHSGVFIHHAKATLRWGSYPDFEAACRTRTSEDRR